MKRAARLATLAGMSAALLIGMGTSPSLAAEPAWKLMNSPQCAPNDNMQDVDMLSTTEGWAVGPEVGPGQRSNAHIERWDGRAWKPSPLGTLKDKPIWLDSVAAISSHDVWATGIYDVTEMDRAHSRFDRRRGAQVVHNGLASEGRHAADRTAGPHTSPGQYVLAHYDGKNWTYQDGPKLPAGYNVDRSSLKATSANDVWSVGSEWEVDSNGYVQDARGFIDRWNGKGWQRMTLPPDVTNQPYQLEYVDGISPNDMWISGEHWDLKNTGYSSPFALHWDGKKFSMLKLPLLGIVGGWDAHNIAVQNDNSVYVSGNIFGDDGSEQDALAHWNGTAWENMTKRPIKSISAMAFNRGTGTLMAGGWPLAATTSTAMYASFDGKAWTTYHEPNLGTNELSHITSIRYGQGNSSKTAYAVGNIKTDQTPKRCLITNSP